MDFFCHKYNRLVNKFQVQVSRVRVLKSREYSPSLYSLVFSNTFIVKWH